MPGISRSDVLDVCADFDESGGSSLALTSWELGTEPGEIADVWALIRSDRLVRQVGSGVVDNESMFRLTREGWRSNKTLAGVTATS
jgi:hypothetical protein